MDLGYMRVSSRDDRQSTDLQHDALIAAGVDPRHLFEDHMSGARDDRPGLDAAMAYLQAGDTLVIWRLDRLGRSLRHLLDLVDDMAKRGVDLKCLSGEIDTTTATGRLMLQLLGALAEYERSLTQERIMAGLDAAARRGRHGGRPRALSQEQIDTARRLRTDGMSIAAVARSIGANDATVARALNG